MNRTILDSVAILLYHYNKTLKNFRQKKFVCYFKLNIPALNQTTGTKVFSITCQ